MMSSKDQNFQEGVAAVRRLEEQAERQNKQALGPTRADICPQEESRASTNTKSGSEQETTEDAGPDGVGPDGQRCRARNAEPAEADDIAHTSRLRQRETPSMPLYASLPGVAAVTGQTFSPTPVRENAEKLQN